MADRRPILMLIDGPSLVYRGYFALPPLTMSDGTLVNAVFGFLQIVLRGMQDLKPDYAMLSFDVGQPQFRFDAYPEYKAGRPSMPDDLRAQFPIVREIAQMMNIPIRELEGYEADDVIGTLVQQAKRAGVDTYIVSGDLDGLQLVNDHVRLLTTRMGVAATVIYDEAKVMERYGLRPDQMLDYKALKGDTSDNIPGVPGVGEKTAVQLLQQFETLDAIYERLDEVKGKLRDRLAEHRESAFMSREVGRIITDLPVELNLDEGAHRPLRPPRGGATLPRAGVPHADRPAAAIEHRAHRLRAAEQDTGSGLQLSLDLLGGARPANRGRTATGAPRPERAPRPDSVSDPGGAIEHVDPRIVRSDADLVELEAWLDGPWRRGRPWLGRRRRPAARARRCSGSRMAGADGSHLVPAVRPATTGRLPALVRPRPTDR